MRRVLFFLSLCLWVSQGQSAPQESTGDCSPNVQQVGRDVRVVCGVDAETRRILDRNQAEEERLTKALIEKIETFKQEHPDKTLSEAEEQKLGEELITQNQATNEYCKPNIENVQGGVAVICGIPPTVHASVHLYAQKERRLRELYELGLEAAKKQNNQLALDIAEQLKVAEGLKDNYEKLQASFKETQSKIAAEDVAVLQPLLDKAKVALDNFEFDKAKAQLDEIIAGMEGGLEKKMEFMASVRFTRARVALAQSDLLEAYPDLKKAYELQPDNIDYTFEYAKLSLEQKEYKKAQRLYENLLDELKQLPESEQQVQQETLLAVMGNLAAIYTTTRERGEEAEKLYQEALKTYKKLSETNATAFFPDIAIIHHNFALLVADDPARRKEAEQNYKEAIKIYRILAQANPRVYLPDVAMALNNFANLVQADPERREEAEQLYREALKIFREFTLTDPTIFPYNYPSAISNFGAFIAQDPERQEEAEQSFLEALTMYNILAKINPQVFLPEVANSLTNLANVVAKDPARREEAEQIFLEALKISRELVQTNPQVFLPYVVRALNNFALLITSDATSIHRKKEAEQSYKEALQITREFAKNNPTVFLPYVANILNNLALLYLKTNDLKRAMPVIEEAISIRQQLFTIMPTVFGDNLASSLAIKGLIQSKQRKTRKKACALLNKALQTAQTDEIKEKIKQDITKLNCPN